MKRSVAITNILILALALTAPFFGCGKTSQEIEFNVPTYENNVEFMFFGDHPLDPNEAGLTAYKEAGFNTYNHYPNAGDVVAAAQMCEKVGLDMIIFGGSPLQWGIDRNTYPDAYDLFPNFFEQFERKGIDFHDYEAIKGFYLIDEPGADLFDDIDEHYISWFNEKYSDMVWHINLLPSYATSDQLNIKPEDGVNIFEKYIERYVDEVLVKVNSAEKNIGLDNYPLLMRGKDNSISESYLNDIVIAGNAAKKAGVDLSLCIQSAGWGNYRFPSKASDIRFQVYSALAVGAKRFEFYAYDTSAMDMRGMSSYGNKSESYYAVQEVINEVKTFDHVLDAFTYDGIKTITGETHAENIGFDLCSDKEIAKLTGIKTVSATHDAIIGQSSDKDGNLGFTVVNYTEPTADILNTVTVEFENTKGVLMYRGGIEMILKTDSNKLTIPLEAGEGVFIIPLTEKK